MATKDNPSRTITLFCWILDVSARPFSVDTEDSTTVAHLKKAIVKEKSSTLANIEADQLVLWKVSPFFFVQTMLIRFPQEVHQYWFGSYSEDYNSRPTV
jgi:hypothetical protein